MAEVHFLAQMLAHDLAFPPDQVKDEDKHPAEAYPIYKAAQQANERNPNAAQRVMKRVQKNRRAKSQDGSDETQESFIQARHREANPGKRGEHCMQKGDEDDAHERDDKHAFQTGLSKTHKEDV